MVKPVPFDRVVSLADLTPDWLTEAFRSTGVLHDGRVTSAEQTPVGTGQMAESVRLAVAYEGDAGPPTVVAKLTAQDERSARMGSSGLYLGEVSFYRTLAGTLSVETPASYYAEHDEEAGGFVLLLEDVAPATHVDQLLGCTPDQAADAVEQAAILHGNSWGDPVLRATPWLANTVDGLMRIVDNLPGLAARFEREFAGIIPESDMVLTSSLLEHQAELKELFGRRQCLWHQDFRADNILFGARGGRTPAVILDWQTVSYGPGVGDISLFIGGSMTTTDRRANEQALVEHYHEVLVAQGVSGYSLSDCWWDYRVMSLHGVFNAMNGSVRVKRTERGDEMWTVWADRHCSQAEDLGAFEALGRLR